MSRKRRKQKRMTQRQFEDMCRHQTTEAIQALINQCYAAGTIKLPIIVSATSHGQTRHIRLERSEDLVFVSDEGEETEVDPFFLFDPREPSDVHVSINDATGQSYEIPLRLESEQERPDGYAFNFSLDMDCFRPLEAQKH